jgi:integrase
MGKRRTGTILKRGRVWWIYYTINGKQVAKSTSARTKTEAQAILNKYLPREVDYDNRGRVTLEEFATAWLERRKVFLKPSVHDGYSSVLKHHILPYFGDKSLNRIFSADVEAFVVHLSKKRVKQVRQISPRTVNLVLILLHRVMGDALDDRRIEYNPVILRKHHLKCTPFEKDHFSVVEMNRFLECVEPAYKPFFTTAWHTGLRLGELIGLKFDDIDWDRSVLIVRRSIYQARKSFIETPPKTPSGRRVIFMTPYLADTLRKFRDQKKVMNVSGYLFERDGKPYDKTGIVRSQFRQALRAAGLRKTLTPHSIRHGLISVMRARFPEHIVKRMAGHSLHGSVTDLYTHVTDEELKEYAVKLEELLMNGQRPADRLHLVIQKATKAGV